MFLTESGYKRKLLKRTFRQGADHITTIDSEPALVKHLLTHPDEISFMSMDVAQKNKHLKRLRVLWQ